MPIFNKKLQRNPQRIYKTMLQNPNIIFESQLGIIILNMQSFCFTLQTTLCWFSPNFMQIVQFHDKYKILICLKEYFWSTLGKEHSIWNKAYKGMETNVSNGLFALSS